MGVDGYNGAISGEVSATGDTRCKNVNGPTLVMAHGQANAEVAEAVSPALTCDHEAPILKAAMSGSNQVPDVLQSATVRRLTPRECERLMGFPDDHTRIPWRGKPVEECPDSPRYKACGNSMCVNVMRWIGMRIELVEGGTV